MKNSAAKYLPHAFWPIALTALLGIPTGTFAATPDLEAEKSRLEQEAAIERLKSEIEGYKNAQRQAQSLGELELRTKEAEAIRAESLARIPPTSTEALDGSVNAEQLGAAGLLVAVDLARRIAPRLCDVIETGSSVQIYDSTVTSGILAARALDSQLILFEKALDDALQINSPRTEEQANKRFKSLGLEFAVATGSIKAVADLVSLFKTNITVKKVDFPESKALLLTAMAQTCHGKILSTGFGYLGQLDTSPYEALKQRILNLMKQRMDLDEVMIQLKASQIQTKQASEKSAMEAQLKPLAVLAKQVDDFIAFVRPHDVADNSPLIVAGKYIGLMQRTQGARILDIDFKLEGLTILKESIFTGQKLRLSATAITGYRLHQPSGQIVKAGLWREMARPLQLDLRGQDVDAAFWGP